MRQLIAPAMLVAALVALSPLNAGAQITKVTPLSHDFGQLKQMQTVRTAVTVTNEGAARLQITSVDADCGCTIPTLDVTSLSPGESTEIRIEFNTKRFSGKVYKAVHINTNDPLNPVIDVMLTAEIHAPLLIEPASQRLGFERSLVGETHTRRIVFTATGDEPLVITAGKPRKGGLFEIKAVNNVDGNPQVAALEVTVPTTMGPGHHRDNVRVTTNVADFPTADIEMQAWVVEELLASPERVSFRFKKSLKQTIRVAPFRKGLVFKVTRAECDLPEIKTEVIETIPNAETKVLLSGQPISKDDPRAIETRGRISGTLRIYVDDRDTPALEIPITYMVRM